MEDNLKLVIAYTIFNGDADKAATYMGITKNAASLRFSKLIRDEKEKATKLGFLDGGAALARKRTAAGGGRAAKKTKAKDSSEAAAENGDDSDHKERGSKDGGGFE